MESPSQSVIERPIVSNPKIRCAHEAQVDPKLLRPNPLNPNTHPPAQIQKFIEIISYTGWRRPITVSKLSGMITKGHGAREAALAAGWTVVPVDYQDYDNEAQELADIMADKFLAEMSTMDNEKLTVMLLKLDSHDDFDWNMTALELPKIEQIMFDVPEWKANRNQFDDLTVPGYQANQQQDQPQAQFAGETQASGGPAENQPHDEAETKTPTRVASGEVRMIQLFFTQQTVVEFTELVQHFQRLLNIDNVTDTVMEVLRSAHNAQTEE